MQEYTGRSDEELMELFYESDFRSSEEKKIFEEITRRWEPRIEVLLRTYRSIDVEGAVQETLTRLFKTKNPRYDPRMPIAPYIKTIARNVANDMKRKDRPLRLLGGPRITQEDAAEEDDDEKQRKKQVVRECLKTLEEQERVVLSLSGKLTQVEIGKAFNVSGSRISQIRTVALRKLKECVNRKLLTS